MTSGINGMNRGPLRGYRATSTCASMRGGLGGTYGIGVTLIGSIISYIAYRGEGVRHRQGTSSYTRGDWGRVGQVQLCFFRCLFCEKKFFY